MASKPYRASSANATFVADVWFRSGPDVAKLPVQRRPNGCPPAELGDVRRRSAVRDAPMLGRPLAGRRDAEQERLGERPPDDLHAVRQALVLADRDGDDGGAELADGQD